MDDDDLLNNEWNQQLPQINMKNHCIFKENKFTDGQWKPKLKKKNKPIDYQKIKKKETTSNCFIYSLEIMEKEKHFDKNLQIDQAWHSEEPQFMVIIMMQFAEKVMSRPASCFEQLIIIAKEWRRNACTCIKEIFKLLKTNIHDETAKYSITTFFVTKNKSNESHFCICFMFLLSEKEVSETGKEKEYELKKSKSNQKSQPIVTLIKSQIIHSKVNGSILASLLASLLGTILVSVTRCWNLYLCYAAKQYLYKHWIRLERSWYLLRR